MELRNCTSWTIAVTLITFDSEKIKYDTDTLCCVDLSEKMQSSFAKKAVQSIISSVLFTVQFQFISLDFEISWDLVCTLPFWNLKFRKAASLVRRGIKGEKYETGQATLRYPGFELYFEFLRNENPTGLIKSNKSVIMALLVLH